MHGYWTDFVYQKFEYVYNHWYIYITEITKIEAGEGSDEEKFVDVVSNKNMKLAQKVLIPVKQFPKVRN